MTPVIDVISDDTFRYLSHRLIIGIGGFNFNMEFTWNSIARTSKAFPGMKKTEPIRFVFLFYPSWFVNFEIDEYK